MDNLAQEKLQNHLLPLEKLLWAGEPQRGLVVEADNIFKTLYVTGMSVVIFFFLTIIVIPLPGLVISMIAAIPAVLWLMAVITDINMRKKTFYGITDQRILIVYSNRAQAVHSIQLKDLVSITFNPHLNGTASIDIGIKQPSRSGGGISWFPNAKAFTSLYRLADGDNVHRLLKAAIMRH